MHAPRNVCIVRCASGVTKIRLRAVGQPTHQRRRVVGDAGGADVVREDRAELIVGHLADVGRLAPERGDAGDRVPRRTAGRLLARSHDAVELLGHLGVDQIHRALRQVVRRQQRVVGLGDHVDDGVADRSHVELVRCSSAVLSLDWGRTLRQCV